jgi:hypothetical protein
MKNILRIAILLIFVSTAYAQYGLYRSGGAIARHGVPTAARPVDSPGAGTYSSAQTVTITTATSGAAICYTVDGSTPHASTPGTCSHGTTYSSAFTSPSSTFTLKAIATKTAFINSGLDTSVYTINPTAATPADSPGTGIYAGAQTVTITTATSGARICYTTDGSTPTASTPGTCSHGTSYVSAFTSPSSTFTLKALATKSGFFNSAIDTSTYTINPTAATPVDSPGTGTYPSAQTVSIVTSTSGATICYTVDGSTPAAASPGTCSAGTTYAGAFTSPSSTFTLKALATKTGFFNSAIDSSVYTIDATASTPVDSPGTGTYSAAQTVTITTATSGAAICYTVDGSTPAASSPGTCSHGTTYAGSFTSPSSTFTLKALATKAGFINSSVDTSVYTINPTAATPVDSPGAGTYSSAQTVTITTATSGAAICYTVDGSTPAATTPGTCSHGTTYTGAFTSPSVSFTLNAIATKAGLLNSGVKSSGYAIGTIISAASCSESDISAALASIPSDGYTVTVPSAPSTPCVWTTTLTYNATHSFTLKGYTTVSGACYPTSCTASDNTIIVDDYDYTSGTGFININTTAGKSVEITGFTFRWSPSQTSVTNNGEIQIGGGSHAVRLDHCHFSQPSGATNGIVIVTTYGDVWGVADHNVIDMTSDDSNWVRVAMQAYDGDSEGLGNKSWADPTNFGSANFVFLENNTLNWNGSYSNPAVHFAAVQDCNAGGRIVQRYNTINGLFLTQMHEMEGDFRGCRAMEDYMNIRVGSSTPNSVYFGTAIGPRMATSLIWGDVTTGFQTLVTFTNDRTNTGHGFGAAYPAVSQPSTTGWGYCGTSTGGSGGNLSPSAYDFSTGSNGYPCADQVGRGIGSLVTGVFPNKFIGGIIQWMGNALEPVKVWDNTYTAPSGAGGSAHYASSSDPSTMQENRDYYLQLPNHDNPATFNGTAGIGQGLYSGITTTCTPGVGYWATDQNTLYVCGPGANTWAAFYTPYTYPHPLNH